MRIICIFSILILMTCLSLYAQAFQNDSNKTLREKQISVQNFWRFVQNGHYSRPHINEEYFNKIFKLFINKLDPNREYLLQSDIEGLKINFLDRAHAYLDEIKESNLADVKSSGFDLDFLQETSILLLQRKSKIDLEIPSLIQLNHNFKIHESYHPHKPNINWIVPYSLDFLEQKERWRKKIKYKLLKIILSHSRPNLSLARENLNQIFKVLINNDYMFSLERVTDLFFELIGEGFDPHTNYLTPKQRENLMMKLSSSYFGLGIELKKPEYIKYPQIKNIPQDSFLLQKDGLRVNDIILSVQKSGEDPIDLSYLPLKEIKWLMRSLYQSKITLTIRRKIPNGTFVNFTRDFFLQEITDKASNNAHVKIIGMTNQKNTDLRRIAIIKIPTFYDGLSEDVEIILNKLKDLPPQFKIHGLVIDLKDNGGGHLDESVLLTGLFIKNGPVVVQKTFDGLLNVYQDVDEKVTYSGPLVVLIDNGTASASEIFAGAIQDYKRGLIVGDKHTYGKGTVQLFTSQYEHKYNFSLKMTTGRFFRITGESNQHCGIKSDIEIPSLLSFPEYEKDHPYSLKNNESIDPNKFDLHDDYYPSLEQLNILSEKSKKRISNDQEFNYLLEDKQRELIRVKQRGYNLKEKELKKEQRKLQAIKKKRAKIRKRKPYHPNYYEILSYPEDKLQEGQTENRKPDIWVHEATAIAADLSRLFDNSSPNETDQNLANQFQKRQNLVYSIEELSSLAEH